MRRRTQKQTHEHPASAGISRRAFFGCCLGAAVVAAGGGAVLDDRRDTISPVLREVVVPVRGLKRELSVVQATDLHARRLDPSYSGIAALLDGRHVDAAVMTGDILDVPIGDRQPAYDLAGALQAITRNVFFLPGNHDPADLGDDLASRGVIPLQHARPVGIDTSDPMGHEVALVYGVDSASIAAASGYGSQLLVIASHTPPNESRLSAGAALGSGSRLFIAGHTHGGQIRVPGIGALFAPMSWEVEEGGHAGTTDFTFLPDLRRKFVDGLYEHEGQRIFVSVGLGTTLVHARLFDRAELVLLHFVPSA